MPVIDFEAAREADFLKGDWLKELDADYQKYLAAGGEKQMYWEELYAAVVHLWDPTFQQGYLKRCEDQWKAANYTGIGLIGIPSGYKYQCNTYFQLMYLCPASAEFAAGKGWNDAKWMPAHHQKKAAAKPAVVVDPSKVTAFPGVKAGAIDFTDPAKPYLEPLKAAIRSLFFDFFNYYRLAQSTGKPESLASLFSKPTTGCLDEKMRRLEIWALDFTKDKPFLEVVNIILSYYTRHVCTLNGWPVMTYNALAMKDNGKYFYLEDVVAYAKQYHGEKKGLKGETVNTHFEAALVATGLSKKRPDSAAEAAKQAAEEAKQAAEAQAQAAALAAYTKAVKELQQTRVKRAETYDCPVSMETMSDPVDCFCGHTFDRKTIDAHFAAVDKFNAEHPHPDEPKRIRDCCPLCREKIMPLLPNGSLKAEITLFLKGGHEAVEKKLGIWKPLPPKPVVGAKLGPVGAKPAPAADDEMAQFYDDLVAAGLAVEEAGEEDSDLVAYFNAAQAQVQQLAAALLGAAPVGPKPNPGVLVPVHPPLPVPQHHAHPPLPFVLVPVHPAPPPLMFGAMAAAAQPAGLTPLQIVRNLLNPASLPPIVVSGRRVGSQLPEDLIVKIAAAPALAGATTEAAIRMKLPEAIQQVSKGQPAAGQLKAALKPA